MANTIFQKLYDSIKNIKTPTWLITIMEKIQTLLISLMLDMGEDIIEKIKAKILEVAEEDIPGWPDKFKKVRDWAIIELNLSHIAKTFIDTIIQVLVAELKKDKR